ncbi:hypothetical protein AB1Y20_000982 [Prymnesium parvum]|uniref:Uncharacterized protein n=1 Tax=Prymnesium parvum TaxID=97485 RepID=A0AB34K7G8_PRYPA
MIEKSLRSSTSASAMRHYLVLLLSLLLLSLGPATAALHSHTLLMRRATTASRHASPRSLLEEKRRRLQRDARWDENDLSFAQRAPSHGVRLVGGAAVARNISCCSAAFDHFMRTPSLSDTSLLNAVTFNSRGDGEYECEMVRIRIFSYTATPLITIRVERNEDKSLLVRVLDLRISIQGSQEEAPWTLQGATVESSNLISWKDLGEGVQQLRTELKLSVGVEVPRFFPLPRSVIESTASFILRGTCNTQCNQLLGEIEEGYRISFPEHEQ